MSDKKQIGGDHYLKQVQPWDLSRSMDTSGSAHVDGCRLAIIKYGFRVKGGRAEMIKDLRKAAHYAEEAARHLESLAGPMLPGLEPQTWACAKWGCPNRATNPVAFCEDCMIANNTSAPEA